jgi:hypothetical protein
VFVPRRLWTYEDTYCPNGTDEGPRPELPGIFTVVSDDSSSFRATTVAITDAFAPGSVTSPFLSVRWRPTPADEVFVVTVTVAFGTGLPSFVTAAVALPPP